MNQEQLISIVRQMLLMAAGGLVTKGYVDSATLNVVIGAVIALGTSGWAIYTRRNKGLIASAAATPEVSKIVTDPQTAIAVTSLKVMAK